MALFASPGMLAQTRPLRSAIANMVIQTIRVLEGSDQTVDSVMEEKSFVKVILMAENRGIVASRLPSESQKEAVRKASGSWPCRAIDSIRTRSQTTNQPPTYHHRGDMSSGFYAVLSDCEFPRITWRLVEK